MDGNELDLQKNTLFLNNLTSTLSVKRDYHLNEYDYEWLLIIEDVLPYLDNIVRNPKRFIVNEEEIVKVELARKITVDSVIHLTQHTNLIQDVDKDGEVKPSKILNINKDDSLDTYENRFAYTLIKNLEIFFNQRVEACGEESFYEDKKTIVYEGKTKVGTEDVSIHIDINSLDACVNDEKSVSNLPERLKKIKMQLDGFHGSELMRTLDKLHVPPVRSPIRKTNVILKNPNFKKAESLWNYIQTFVSKDQTVVDKKNYFDNSTLKEQYDQSFLLEYIANRSIGEEKSGLTDKKIVNEMLFRVIENILETDVDMDEDKLEVLFNKQIKIIKNRNKDKKNNVDKILVDRFSREKNYRDEIINLLNTGVEKHEKD